MSKSPSYITEYVAWGCSFILLGLVLNLPIWVIGFVIVVFFTLLSIVHHRWG